MDHLATVHDEKVNCDMCDFQVYPFERLKRHLILKHKTCSKCGEKFENSMDLESHFENVHKEKKLAESLRHSFQCEECDFMGTKRALKLHAEKAHNAVFATDNNACASASSLKQKCDRCNFTYKFKNELYIHNIRMHKRCIACNEDCYSKKRIMEHLASIHGEKVQCELCDFQAYPFDRVARHQIQKHNVCSTCGQRFENQNDLEQHCDLVHKKRMPESMNHTIICDFCPYQGTKAAVKLHTVRVHLQEYKYACDLCDFKTYMKTKLDDHVQRREKQTQKLFFCDACEYKSCTSYGLVFHKSKVHNVTKLVKKYTCGYCWSKFTVMAHFRTHILSKHMGEEGNYSCDICGFKTFDKCYLGKHIKKHEQQGGLFRDECSF